MSYLTVTNGFGAVAKPNEGQPFDAGHRRRQAQLVKLAIGTGHAIGITNINRPYMRNGFNLARFADEFSLRDGKDVLNYEQLAPLPQDYVDLLEALPRVIRSSYKPLENGFPIYTDEGTYALAWHLKKIFSHAECPVKKGGESAVPKTHARMAARILKVTDEMPASTPAPGMR